VVGIHVPAGRRDGGKVGVDAIALPERGRENPGAERSRRVPFSVSLQMVGFRADIGYFENRVPHDLLLQSEVIAVFGRLPNRGRKSIELKRWRWARGQVRIVGEDRVRQVA